MYDIPRHGRVDAASATNGMQARKTVSACGAHASTREEETILNLGEF
jgi:hypothetical protein